MPVARKRLLRVSLVAGAVALGVYLLLRLPPFAGRIEAFNADISLPDALIRSYSLSRLPADLLRVPLARDVLTEDFVAYYEENEGRLALSGTVRRIAYEHKLDLPGRLIESTLDEPAEVALWRGTDGRLRDFVIVMSRNTLARAIQMLLPVIGKATDAQISKAGRLDGSDAEILVVEYGYRHRLLLLAKGERIVVLSNPGMLFASDGEHADKPPVQSTEAARFIRKLLNSSEAMSPFARKFRLGKTPLEKKHELILGARVFTFGYDNFTPGLAALSLTFDDRGAWQSAALTSGGPVSGGGGKELWADLPHGPSLCASLPVNWARVSPVLKKFNASLEHPAAPTLFTDHFAGPAAVCWYKDSRLYTPLFAARLKSGMNEKQAREFFSIADSAIAGQGEVSFDAENGVVQWQGTVVSRFGVADENGGPRSLKPALALHGDVVFFSPDAALVGNALDVAAKRYPALDNSFARTGGNTLAFVAPQALAALLRDEALAALPRNEEAVFRNAADAYLLPRLDALARYPSQRIKLAKGRSRNTTHEWRALEWEPGNSLPEPGNSLLEPGSSLLKPGSSLLEPGDPLLEPGNSLLEPGDPLP
ncbi:MAG: DUF2138 family protein [Azoarcus sp.]|jgi:uncharacterized protein YfaA (DUF2138 family)|nr:DUF2138 family protein [Azoarcus sp.]